MNKSMWMVAAILGIHLLVWAVTPRRAVVAVSNPQQCLDLAARNGWTNLEVVGDRIPTKTAVAVLGRAPAGVVALGRMIQCQFKGRAMVAAQISGGDPLRIE